MSAEQETMLGSAVLDIAGTTVGTVSGLLLSPDTRQPRWLAVRLPDEGQRLLPWSAATRVGRWQLVVPYPASHIAASMATDGQHVSAADARQLRGYYGLPEPAPDDIGDADSDG